VRPLRIYLLILVLGAMLPGTLLTGVLVWRAFAQNRTVTERRLIESARVDAAALEREFAGTISVLEALATSPALDDDRLEAFHAEGRRIQATQPGFYSVILSALDGRQLLTTRLPWGAPLLPGAVDQESFHRLIETRHPVVGSVRRPPRGGPEFVFPIRVPVMRNGQLKYVLSAIVNVDSLARVVPKQLVSSEEWTRAILDSYGTIAVRTRNPETFIGTRTTDAFREQIARGSETVSRQTTREGIGVYAATSRSSYGWTAVIVVPRTTLDEALIASMTGFLTGGLLLMICGLVAVLFVSRRLSADLAGATAAAEAVAEGRDIVRRDGHVAETRRLQRSLASAASLLEKRARERDEEIRRTEAARADAEDANRTKDQFLAVLGHELRNPLAPALTALELMRVRDPNVFTRERNILERQVNHMTRLVNDLLDVSRLTRGKTTLDRRRFELHEAVDRALDMVRPLIDQKEHELAVSVPTHGLVIDGDIDRIVQVLSNLLANAAKYTDAGGRVMLRAMRVNDRVKIECEDNGPGMPPDLVPKLFNPFAQGPRNLDRREGGLGLGLALARSFTELHGGTIAVESVERGTGSRFVVTLPLATSVVEAPTSQLTRQHGNGLTRRILVVDDNEDATEMLRDALGIAGHVVAAAGTAAEALALTEDFQPEVGVLDIGLPDMDGYELAGRLRQSNPAIRLIALTGYGQEADLEAARNAGFDAHCAKPVTIVALLELIDASPAA
jgi:signal transduction histidine kinase/CheY-like chemotaxis protein